MSLNSAIFIVKKYDKNAYFSVKKDTTGSPETMAAHLNAILGGRRHIARDSPGRFVALLCASARLDRSNFEIFAEAEAARYSHEWRYDIQILRREITLEVTHIESDGEETTVYEGSLERFISKAMRSLKRPRGRTPKGYSNRAEYEAARAARRARHSMPPNPGASLKESILRERAASAQPILVPNLDGVLVHESAEHRRIRRRQRGD